MKFENKVVFITGGASGIGRNAAITFAKKGAKVVIADWNITGAQETAHMIEEAGSKAWAYQLDVSKYDQVEKVISNVHLELGSLDIALNNAGVGGTTPAKTANHTLEDWDSVIAVNQSGVFYCMKEELKYMSAQKSGTIVNVASIAGLKGLPRQAAYVASKHAVIGLTKTAALEYASDSIRVNAVCPVFTNSPMLENMFRFKEELRAKLVHTIPLGRYGETQDIVSAIEWLCDPKSSFITGLCLPIDGGQTA
jgi:NAD(P)-dependent dehydrogenase (short-subunit alcohol dehydrogenase family)